jgi:2-polyprenyl-3-methyl-5-hydroxy-6-metoxy-1,4-benzoquinol methylase
MQIVRCQRCRMMYQNPRIAETEMADAYQTIGGYSRFADQETAKRALFRARIGQLMRERRLPAHGSFLDFGASRGVMLEAIAELLPDWERAAVELSPSARAHLAERGHRAAGAIEELPPGLTFDWVNIDNVLEHLPNPLETLVQLKSRLSPGGFIYVEVPNESFLPVRYRVNDWVRGFSKPPTAEGHINLFTPRTLRKLFTAAGFHCERFWLESVATPHRLKGALGADETPQIARVFRLLRTTRLDVTLRAAYFLCARIQMA